MKGVLNCTPASKTRDWFNWK